MSVKSPWFWLCTVFLLGVLASFAWLSKKHVKFVECMEVLLLKDMAEMQADVRRAKFGNSISLARMDRLEAACPGVSKQERAAALFGIHKKEKPAVADTVVVQ